MDRQTLQQLRIEPNERRRRSGPGGVLLLIIFLLTAGLGILAWPRKEATRTIGTLADARQNPAPTPAAPAVPTPPPPAPAGETPDPARARPGSGAPQGAGPGAGPRSPATPAAAGAVVLTTSGYIINRERIELSPRMLGVVKWLGVRKGDRVHAGDVVVLLDDAEQQARLKEAEAAVAAANQALERARLRYARIRQLSAQKIEAAEREEDARMEVAVLEAQLAQAAAGRGTAQTFLDWTVIRSPIDGVVLEKLVDVNELVSPQSFGGERSPSTALVALADPNDLQVEIDLNEADLAKVFLNQRCRVAPEAYPDRSYDGYVAEIAPEASRQKGTLQIKVQIVGPDRYLTPQLSAKVDFLAK